MCRPCRTGIMRGCLSANVFIFFLKFDCIDCVPQLSHLLPGFPGLQRLPGAGAAFSTDSPPSRPRLPCSSADVSNVFPLAVFIVLKSCRLLVLCLFFWGGGPFYDLLFFKRQICKAWVVLRLGWVRVNPNPPQSWPRSKTSPFVVCQAKKFFRRLFSFSLQW